MAAEEGKASKGIRHRGRFPGPRGPDPVGRGMPARADQRSRKRGEPQGRLRGATNPHAVEGPVFGLGLCGGNRWSREERQERNVFGTWQSRAEVWTTVQAGVDAETAMSAKGRSMNPMRGVQLLGRSSDRSPQFGPREPVRHCRGGVSGSRSDEEYSRRGGKGQTNHCARGASDDAPWLRSWL